MARLLSLTVLTLICLFSLSQERNFQLWNLNSAEIVLGRNTSLKFSEKVHFTLATNSIDMKFGDAKFQYDFTRWFSMASGCRFLLSRQNYGWLQELRPMIYGILSAEIKNFDIDFSNRISYRFLNKENNHFRHWQKIVIDFPKITKTKMQFYNAFESFCKLNREKIHMFRLYAGLKTIQKEHFEMKVYYAFQKNKVLSSWNTTDIIGINFNIEL
jgi:hypothetical protein